MKQVYRGPYSRKKMEKLREQDCPVSNVPQLQEGIVILPVKERKHEKLGRVILKDVSDRYLTRKGNATEHN